MTVTIVVSGGLGNQLFQYAAARTLCDSRGDERLKIDTRFYPGSARGTPKGLWLERFPVRAEFQRYPDSGPCSAHGPYRRLLRQFTESLPQRRYFESVFGYDPSFQGLRPDAVAFGVFHSYKYFWHNIDRIRSDLSISPKLDSYYSQYINTASETISIHVRRGDYVGNTTFEMKDTIGYYREAMTRSIATDSRLVFRIFSDDLEWCKMSGIFPDGTEYFDPPSPLGPIEDLYVMSQSAHHIIANSSYSWWAACLGYRPGKRVVAPSVWVGGAKSQDMPINPPEWIEI